MKHLLYPVLLAVCIAPALLVTPCSAQSTPKEISKWYKSRQWLHGVPRTPAGTINVTEFAKQYRANKERWDFAFEWLKKTDLHTLTPGRHLLDGDNVFINVTEGPTKNKEDVLFEAHKKYADIHCVVYGSELIGIAPYAKAVVKKEYDAAKDIAFYEAKGKYYVSDSTTLFILFPEKDAHCGAIKVKESTVVKKVTVKIKTAK